MRVLGRIRLSRWNEESTSIERQREIIQGWADNNGHEVVAWAEDTDVSGAVSPFEAPALAPYLREPLAGSWDILCAWKLDRVARSSISLHQVFGWIQDNDKTLVCVADSIDLSTWTGRLVASVIAGVAEGELEAIKERAASSKQKLRKMGRWEGGRPPYGWRGSRLQGGGYRLEHDPETFPVLRRIIDQFLTGTTAGAIATQLTAEGVPTPVNHLNGNPGGTWHGQSIRRMLASRSLLGWATHNGAPVLDEHGKPVIKGEPGVTADEFQRIQDTLAGRTWAKTVPDRTSPLLGVLECWECGSAMHLRRNKHGSGRSAHYYCSAGCKRISVNAVQVQALVNDSFRDTLGEYPVLEKVVTPATDHSLELAEAKAAYDDTARFISSAPTAETRQTLFDQLGIIGKRIADLEAAVETPERVQWIETSETYADQWDRLDDEGRRQLMIRTGIRFRAQQFTRGNQHRQGVIQSEIIVPGDLQERLGGL